jgi:AcrR family transcriptional regulator
MEVPRLKILAAAGPVFAENGYQSATVREICRRADVNVAAVNYYFGDKERLYTETVRQAHRHLVEQFPMPTWPTNAAAEARLRGFIHTMLTRMIGDESTPWEQRLMLREVLQPTAACRDLAEEYFRPHFEMLLGVLAELLPVGTPAHKLRQTGFSIVGQCLFYRVSSSVVEMLTPDAELGDFTIEHLADHIAEFTLAAIRPADSAAQHQGVR